MALPHVDNLDALNAQAQAIANGDYNIANITVITSYPGEGNGGGDVVYHLKEGIERFTITDINNAAGSVLAQSEIWIMLDQFSARTMVFNHVPGGCNILYLDGHVEFEKYPNEQPLNRGLATIIGTF